MHKRSSNLVLSCLDERERRRLAPHLAPVELANGAVLADTPRGVDDLYFVEEGLVCVVAYLDDRQAVAVAITGREGVGGAPALLGGPLMRHRLLVQVPGSAQRIDAGILRRERRALPRVTALVEQYVDVVVAQVAQTAICNRYHTGRERLAYWLLLMADRASTTRLPVTHRDLAQIVGGARSLVTTSLNELRDEGAIDYRRGMVSVNRATLACHCCECYATLRKVMRQWTGKAAGSGSGS